MIARLAAIGFFTSLVFALALALARPDWLVAPAALAGWWVADFISGAGHMYLDYRPCVPGVGLDQVFFHPGPYGSAEYNDFKREITSRINPFERLVFKFKLHHPRPDSLGRRSFWYLINTPALYLALPLCLLLDVACWSHLVPAWLTVALVVATFGSVLAQYFHGTLHREDAPWFVVLARRIRLLMTPKDHAVHHATLTRDFATTSGWSNPVLNGIFNLARNTGLVTPDGLTPR